MPSRLALPTSRSFLVKETRLLGKWLSKATPPGNSRKNRTFKRHGGGISGEQDTLLGGGAARPGDLGVHLMAVLAWQLAEWAPGNGVWGSSGEVEGNRESGSHISQVH